MSNPWIDPKVSPDIPDDDMFEDDDDDFDEDDEEDDDWGDEQCYECGETSSPCVCESE